MNISKRENMNNNTHEYKITILGISFYKTLCQESIIINQYPIWYKVIKWLNPILCKHEYTYDKHSWINLTSGGVYNREYICKLCNKHIHHKPDNFTN